MLDKDLAVLYGVETKALNRAVIRNIERFPAEFMFQLTRAETENLRYQFGTSSHGGRRYRPYVFTEQGVAMLSSVLKSKRAIQVNIQIIKTFVRLRELIISNKELRRMIEKMEKKNENRFRVIFDTIKRILESQKPDPLRKIGFRDKEKDKKK